MKFHSAQFQGSCSQAPIGHVCPSMPLGDCSLLQEGDSSVTEFLLQNGAKWEWRDWRGCTPLHYAVAFDRPHIAKSLLQRGADRQALIAESNAGSQA